MNYHGTNRSSIVTEVDFFKAIPDTETPSDTLADGPLAINWKTDVAKGTVKGTLSLARPDCWAGVGLTRNMATASMVGGDFIVGERDGKTQVAAVRGYYPSPKGTANTGNGFRLLCRNIVMV